MDGSTMSISKSSVNNEVMTTTIAANSGKVE